MKFIWAIVRRCLRDPTLSGHTVQYRRATDGQTDSIYRASMASRSKYRRT